MGCGGCIEEYHRYHCAMMAFFFSVYAGVMYVCMYIIYTPELRIEPELAALYPAIAAHTNYYNDKMYA